MINKEIFIQELEKINRPNIMTHRKEDQIN